MQETKQFWRHARFRDLGLLQARFTRHRYELHTHPTYVIALITEGCERVRIGNQSVLAPAGSVLVVNPEEWHDGEAAADQGWAYRTFYPSVGLVSAVAEELGRDRSPLFPRAALDDPELARTMATAHRESLSQDATAAETTLLAALGQLVLRHGNRGCRPEQVEGSGSRRRLLLYEEIIADNLTGELHLQRFADAARVTRFQVIRDFKKVVGLTPSAFIRDRKLRRANLLIGQGANLAEAALDAGFADQSHLSRTFRAAHGITPGMLKRAGIVAWK